MDAKNVIFGETGLEKLVQMLRASGQPQDIAKLVERYLEILREMVGSGGEALMSDKPNFTGNAEQKALAAQIFQLMSAQGDVLRLRLADQADAGEPGRFYRRCSARPTAPRWCRRSTPR